MAAGMEMNISQNIVQRQELRLTAEMRLTATLLPLTVQELQEQILQELEENPTLEMLEDSPDENEPPTVDNTAADDSDTQPSDDEIFDKSDIDWEQYFQQDEEYARRNTAYEIIDSESSHENYVETEQTLQDALLVQLKLNVSEAEDYSIGEFLIGNINEWGYLTIDISDAAEIIDKDIEDVQAVSDLIKTFSPSGVGARDLKECLMIQYQNRGIEDDIIESIIEKHLDDLQRNKIQQIAKELSVDIELIKEARDIIKTLNPKPGLEYATARDTHYITPDVFVELVGDNYVVRFNEKGNPRLRRNKFYMRVIKDKKSYSKEEYSYIKDRLNSAKMLINCISQRRNTILKVAEEIVKYQRDFFDNGKEALKPLTRKVIAEKIGMHEATVSRAVTNKYMETPRGLFGFNFFFSSFVESLDSNDDEKGVSSTVVKEKIKQLVLNEDKKHPLADAKIVELLKKDGIEVSRRAITKYRLAMNIPSSNLRKEH